MNASSKATKILIISLIVLGGLAAGLIVRAALKGGDEGKASSSPVATNHEEMQHDNMNHDEMLTHDDSMADEEMNHDESSNHDDMGLADMNRPGMGDMVDADATNLVALNNPRCPIMDGAVKDDAPQLIYNGMVVKFCCPGCDKDFLADPIAGLQAIQDSGVNLPEGALLPVNNPDIIDAGNDVCPVMGEAIKEPRVKLPYVVHRGVKVTLCCDECIEEFAADPDKFLLVAAESGNIPKERLPR